MDLRNSGSSFRIVSDSENLELYTTENENYHIYTEENIFKIERSDGFFRNSFATLYGEGVMLEIGPR